MRALNFNNVAHYFHKSRKKRHGKDDSEFKGHLNNIVSGKNRFALNRRYLTKISLILVLIFNPALFLTQNVSAFRETHNFYFSKNISSTSAAHLRIRLAFFGFDNFTHDISVGIFLTSSGEAHFEKLTELSLTIKRDNNTLRAINRTDAELPDNGYYYGFRSGIFYESVISIIAVVKGEFLIDGVRQEITFNEIATYQLKEAPFYRKYIWPIVAAAVLLISVIIAGVMVKKNKKQKRPIESIDLTL